MKIIIYYRIFYQFHYNVMDLVDEKMKCFGYFQIK